MQNERKKVKILERFRMFAIAQKPTTYGLRKGFFTNLKYQGVMK